MSMLEAINMSTGKADSVSSIVDPDNANLSILRVSIADASFTLDGNVNVDVSAFKDTAGDQADAFVYANGISLAAVDDTYQGVGGLDVTADKFQALHIAKDDAAMPATPHFLPIGGEYRAAATVYTDGDAVVLQTDSSGHLMVSSDAIYAEDTAHTTGDEGMQCLAVRVDTAAALAGTTGDYIPFTTDALGNLRVIQTDVSGNATPAGDAVARSMYTAIGDGVETVSVAVDNATATATPNVLIEGGIYKASMDTYDDNDAVPLHFDANGRLITSVELNDYTDDSTEFTAGTSKALAIMGFATSDTVDSGDIGALAMTVNRHLIVAQATHDNLNVNANLQQGDADVAIGNAVYIRPTDGTNTMPTLDANTRAGFVKITDGTDELPIATDNAVAKTKGVQVLGAYNATLPTYGDGDSAILQTDANGRLISTVELTDYTDDSAEFTVASSKGLAIMGIASTDEVDANDVGALAMSVKRELLGKSKLWDGTTELGIAVDDSAMPATPPFIPVGAEYRASPTTYADGDATVLQSDVNGSLNVNVKTTVAGGTAPTITPATAVSGAIATTTSLSTNYKLVSVTCHFNIAPTTSEDFSITLDATDGVAYDTVLFSVDPSESSATDIVFIPDGELLFESGDEIAVAFPNTEDRTFGLRIVTQEI